MRGDAIRERGADHDGAAMNLEQCANPQRPEDLHGARIGCDGLLVQRRVRGRTVIAARRGQPNRDRTQPGDAVGEALQFLALVRPQV